MQRLRRIVDAATAWVLVALMGVSVVNVIYQVLARNLPSLLRFLKMSWLIPFVPPQFSWTEELARYLLVWVGLIGAGYAVGRRAHLAIDLLPTNLSGRKRQVNLIVIELCVVLFAATVMVWGGSRLVLAQLSVGQIAAALPVKMGYVYLAAPLGGILMVFYSIMNLFDLIRGSPSAPGFPVESKESHGME